MANEGPRAYDFEPIFSQEELAVILQGREREEVEGNASEEEAAFHHHLQRLNNVYWCQCTNCGLMPTLTECRCCREIPQLGILMGEHACITNHEDFETVYLNRAVLRAVLVMRNDVRGHDVNVQRELDNRSYRYSAYRMFTYWVHGRLGKGVRKVVPSCAVRKVRERFPDTEGQYVGFIRGEHGEDLEVGEVEAI